MSREIYRNRNTRTEPLYVHRGRFLIICYCLFIYFLFVCLLERSCFHSLAVFIQVKRCTKKGGMIWKSSTLYKHLMYGILPGCWRSCYSAVRSRPYIIESLADVALFFHTLERDKPWFLIVTRSPRIRRFNRGQNALQHKNTIQQQQCSTAFCWYRMTSGEDHDISHSAQLYEQVGRIRNRHILCNTRRCYTQSSIQIMQLDSKVQYAQVGTCTKTRT